MDSYHVSEDRTLYKLNEPFKSQSLLEHVATARHYIEQNLHERISLADLALQGGLSLYYFARRFKDITGASPKQYILSKRLERAYLLLSQGDVSVSEVAYQTGFTDQSHLVRYFKKYWGLTPNALRHTRTRGTAPELQPLDVDALEGFFSEVSHQKTVENLALTSDL
jgi:AraC family transcriptional regulator